MLSRWLKPCPRCRGNHLLEMKDELRQAVECLQCGYVLSWEEIRFLMEDIAVQSEHERKAA